MDTPTVESSKQVSSGGRDETTSAALHPEGKDHNIAPSHQGRWRTTSFPLHETPHGIDARRHGSLSDGIGVTKSRASAQHTGTPTRPMGASAATGTTAAPPAGAETASVLSTLSLNLSSHTNICYINSAVFVMEHSSGRGFTKGSTLFGQASTAWRSLLHGPRSVLEDILEGVARLASTTRCCQLR